EQTDTGRTLVDGLYQEVVHNFVLDSPGPVHDIGRADIRVDPGGGAPGKVGTDEGRAAVRGDVELRGARALRKAERRSRVAHGSLNRSCGEILFKVLGQVNHEEILSDDAEVGSKDQLGPRIPSDAEAGLEILIVAGRDCAGLVDDGTEAPRNRVSRGGNE